MSSATSYDRLQYVIALAVKNQITPDSNIFVGFARKIYASRFAVSERIMKEEIRQLVTAWHADRWKKFIQESPYFNKKETEKWIKTH